MTVRTAEFAVVESPARRGLVYELRDRWGKRLGVILAPCMELVFGRSAPTFLLNRTPRTRPPRDREPIA